MNDTLNRPFETDPNEDVAAEPLRPVVETYSDEEADALLVKMERGTGDT